MAKRVMVSGVDELHVNGIVDRIHEVYHYKIYNVYKHEFWGLDPNEELVLTGGPAESLINQKYKANTKVCVKAYEQLTHIIICPVLSKPWEFGPPEIYQAALFRAYDFLESYASKRVPKIVLMHNSKEDNWRLIVSLLSDIKLVKGL